MEVLIKTEDAIDAYKGAANLARSLGVSRAAISQWGICSRGFGSRFGDTPAEHSTHY